MKKYIVYYGCEHHCNTKYVYAESRLGAMEQIWNEFGVNCPCDAEEIKEL